MAKRTTISCYSYRERSGALVVDCMECRRNRRCRYYDGSVEPCDHDVLVLSIGGRPVRRRGTCGCYYGVLGAGLSARSWLEHERELRARVWRRVISRLPACDRATATRIMDADLARMDHAIEMDELHSKGVL